MAEFRICVPLGLDEARSRLRVLVSSDDASMTITEISAEREAAGRRIVTSIWFTTDNRKFSADTMQSINAGLDRVGLDNRL